MRAVFIVVLLFACEASPDPKTNFDVIQPYETRGPREPYPTYVEGLIDRCCPLKPWHSPPPERAAVCRALQWNVEDGGDAPSMRWGPECHEAIPTESLLLGLRNPKRSNQRVAIAQLLAERGPSEHLQRALFRELLTLQMPSNDPGVDDTLVNALTCALATGGEAELKPIAESLHSSNATERLWAAHVLALAMRFPLDLPEVLPTLEALTHDPDWQIRERARQAIDQSQLWSSTNRDSSAGGVLGILIPVDRAMSPYEPFDDLTSFRASQDHSRSLLATKLFAMRRFFCDSKVATTILAMLERSEDLSLSHLAKHATRLRWKRCRTP